MDRIDRKEIMLKLIMSLIVVASLVNCAGVDVKSEATTIAKDCGSQFMRSKLPQVFELAKDILEGEAVDYKQQLDKLEVDGVALGFCAARKYVELNASPIIVKSSDGVTSRTSALTITNIMKVHSVMRAVDYVSSK